MASPGQPEVLLVSLGSTSGLRLADEQLCEALRAAGAAVRMVRAEPPRPLRTMALTDLAWARAARVAARTAIAEGRRGAAAQPPAVIYSSTTAALWWPLAGAIRFDACAAANRPGRHGVWQRTAERRRLAHSALLLPWSEAALQECPAAASAAARAGAGQGSGRSVVVPVAVEASGPPAPTRDIAAITYAANPLKKGLDRVLAAWRASRAASVATAAGPEVAARAGEQACELVVAGTDEHELRRAGIALPGPEDGVRLLGLLPHEEYRALLRRARVFVCAPRREDYGIAQLEALADGCMLVTTPAPGPYVALGPARAADPRLVGEDLAAGLTAALREPLAGYRELVAEELQPFGPSALARVVERDLVPRLMALR
jgi:glycosyltransferase involved in cell wall biosynthesis